MHAFALGFADKILGIGAFVVFGIIPMSLAGKIRTEDPIGVFVVFRIPRWFFIFQEPYAVQN